MTITDFVGAQPFSAVLRSHAESTGSAVCVGVDPRPAAHSPQGFEREHQEHNRMSGKQLENLNVISNDPLITPEALKQKMPLTDKAAATVTTGRQTIYDILDRKDAATRREGQVDGTVSVTGSVMSSPSTRMV